MKIKAKKKTVITLSVLLTVLLALIAGALIFFFTSPFPTALRFRDAVEQNDSDTFYRCIEPDERLTIRKVQTLTGASLPRLVQYATSTTERNPDETVRYRLVGYRRDGDSAVLSLRASADDGGEWDVSLSMVRLDGTWYVTIRKSAS